MTLVVTIPKENSLEKEEKIFIHFIVDKQGNPQCIEPVKEGNKSLRELAVEYVEKLQFSPAMLKGKPVITPMILPIRFRINSISNRK